MSNSNNNDNENKIRRKKISSSDIKTTSPSSKSTSPTDIKKSINKRDKSKFFRVTGILVLILLVLGAAGGSGLVIASLRDVQPVTKSLLSSRTLQASQFFYDDEETLLSNAPSLIQKEVIDYEYMPTHLVNAIIAIEDERFYEHNGVDWKGFARSVFKTLTGDTQGGSTIAMQTSKMLLTTYDQTLTRKIKDMYYALEMTQNLSHEDILETYLNNFSVGRNLSGVQAGAQGYFSKDASELTLAECALLAGSTQSPTRYSAYNAVKLDGTETKEDLENKLLFNINTDSFDDPTEVEFDMIKKLRDWELISTDTYNQLMSGNLVVRKAVNNPNAKKRQEVVLFKMLELEYITTAEYEEAVAEEIVIKLPEVDDAYVSSVEDYVESEVLNALIAQGNSEDDARNMIANGGLIVSTTINQNIQNILDDEYSKNSNFPGHKIGPDGIAQPQSSTVIIDHKTGQIKGMIGGRQITVRKGHNRSLIPQQPGSTIKPLSVYAPAIDNGLTQSDTFTDTWSGLRFDHGSWTPRTTTRGSGSMSLRQALSYSSNFIAVKAAETFGSSPNECIEVMLEYLNNFGITSLEPNDEAFAPLTLGGMTTGISPLEMAAAYATFANGGIYIEPTVFTTIATSDGQIIVNNTPQENRVLDPGVAYVVTDMLQAVIKEGIAGSARLSRSMPSAGKTGTTNNALGIWFVGYTPYYTGATFIGDDAGITNPETGQTIARRSMGSSSNAARLWAKIMNRIHEDLQVVQFDQPDNVYFTRINLYDGGRDPNGVSAAFLNGSAPSRPTTHSPEKDDEKDNEEEDNIDEDGADDDNHDDNKPNEGNPDDNKPPNGGADEGGTDGNKPANGDADEGGTDDNDNDNSDADEGYASQ